MAERRIYAIDPAKYPQEVIAVAFAKYSRDPRSVEEILPELTDAKAAQFHEKYVVGYGHASVAEHAVLHIALENVSRYAVESVESPRLASYTEKSTRYQVIDRQQIYEPRRVAGSKWIGDYREIMDLLFDAYEEAIPAVRKLVADRNPRKDKETEAAYERRIRTTYIDACRYGLPRAVLANVGMTANARVIEAACVKMLSHRLEEVREIGAEVKQVAVSQAPTLVKYAQESEFLRETEKEMRVEAAGLVGNRGERQLQGVEPKVEMVDWDPQGENKFFAAWLYRFGNGMSFEDCMRIVGGMDERGKSELAEKALGKLGRHDKAGREMELPRVVFDVVLDYGAYYDFKRNRPMTQIVQEVGDNLGVVLPAVLYEVGVGEKMEAAMRSAIDVAKLMKPDFDGEDGYLYANGTLMRMLLSMNLREQGEFWKTRSSPQANPGYKFLAAKIGELGGGAYPMLWSHMTSQRSYQSSGEVYNSFYKRE